MLVAHNCTTCSDLELFNCKFSVGWESLSTCVLHCCALLLLVSDCWVVIVLFRPFLDVLFSVPSYILVVLAIVQSLVQWEVLVSKCS